MARLVVFPSDPLSAYVAKGEIKPRYFNPNDCFDEVHVMSLWTDPVPTPALQPLVGGARLAVHCPLPAPVSLRSPASYWRGFRAVASAVRALRPDVVRAYNNQLGGALAVYAAGRIPVASVISLHIDPEEGRRYGPTGTWVSRWFTGRVLERYSLSEATRVICVSEFLTRYARRYGARSVDVIYNRVDTARFRRTADPAHARPRILSVGRLDPQKRQDTLIRAVRHLDVDLVLIGDGSRRDELRRLASEIGVEDRVRFVPRVSHGDIHRYYLEADIFAVSSRYEGFCIPVLEAMAASLPVVVNDKEPMPEILGGTGCVVPNRPEAYEAAFRRLAADADLRRRLGERARERAVVLDGREMEAREESLYRELMRR